MTTRAMHDTVTCVIVDDEPLARARLEALLAESAYNVEISGQYGNARDALPVINDVHPDVIFVDVQMPVLDGFDLVDLIVPPRPPVVFVTAYDEYAIRAFEVHAVDYLTKPVRLERLNRSLKRIVDGGRTDTNDEMLSGVRRNHLSCLTTKTGNRLKVLQVGDIAWIGSEDKLTIAHVGDSSYGIHFTLDELEKKLDPDVFVRTHRSCLVNISFVSELQPWFSGTYQIKLRNGQELPVARRRARDIRRVLGA